MEGRSLKAQVHLLSPHRIENPCHSLEEESKKEETNEKQIYALTRFSEYSQYDSSSRALLTTMSLVPVYSKCSTVST